MEPLVIRVFEDLSRPAVFDVHTTCQKLWTAWLMSDILPTDRIVNTLLRDLGPPEQHSYLEEDRFIYLKAILNVGRGQPESFLLRVRMNVYEESDSKCIILNYHLADPSDAAPFYERHFSDVRPEWHTRKGVQFVFTMWTHETLKRLGINEVPPVILARNHALRVKDSYDEPVELSFSCGFPECVMLEFPEDRFGFTCGIYAKSESVGVLKYRGVVTEFSDNLVEVHKKISLYRSD
jgi:hypothetical protein